MGTASILYGGNAKLRLTADGMRPATSVAVDRCCPEVLCVPLCDTLCSFVDLLPSGPLWDYQKSEAKRVVGEAENCAGPYETDCPSMAWYAVYGGLVLHDIVQQLLWPTIREASPETAVTTLDSWLERYGWEDCYTSHCRSLGSLGLSPYERPGDCGPIYCEPSFSDEFNCALKHAILLSLVRAQRGFIKTLDGINWVLEPLRAVVRPRAPYPDDYQSFIAGELEVEPCLCREAEFEICQSSELLPGCPPLDSNCGNQAEPQNMAQLYQCEPDDPEILVYPAVLAAECIVRSFMKRQCPNIVYRCAKSGPIPQPPLL